MRSITVIVTFLAVLFLACTNREADGLAVVVTPDGKRTIDMKSKVFNPQQVRNGQDDSNLKQYSKLYQVTGWVEKCLSYSL